MKRTTKDEHNRSMERFSKGEHNCNMTF